MSDYPLYRRLPVRTGDGSGVDSPSDDEEVAVDPETMEVDALLSHESFMPEGELLEALSCDIVKAVLRTYISAPAFSSQLRPAGLSFE